MRRVMLTAGLVLALQAGASAVSAQTISEADEAFVCRAAIASIMGHPLQIIDAERRDSLVWTTYVRPSDGQRWTNVCRISGDQVEWAEVENGSIGNWRTDNFGGDMNFELDELGVTFTIAFSDGSEDSDSFARD